MRYYPGVDNGVCETKASLVNGEGGIVVSAARGHRMLAPLPGWRRRKAKSGIAKAAP